MRFLFFLLLLNFNVFAQDSLDAVNPKKPKIGLVLSGGGAKGLAHIGVLKVLEKAGIKIDYIGGTSMGAVIGGLYASGYNAQQLDSIFSTLNTDALIQDYIPRSAKAFTQKRNDEVYFFTLPFKKFKISSPKGLSKGMYNFNMLSKLTHPVKDINDFSKLPIPFFCIATDIETGNEVIMKSGVLSQAIFASGAIPTLYSPIEIDGKMLVDGGVMNNYPIEELKEMGADYIIGVDVQEGLKTKENLEGVTSILLQISNFTTNEKTPEKIKLTDIYIRPDIKTYNVLSFDKGKEIINKGEEAANAFLEKLMQLSVNHTNEGIKTEQNVVINNIEINALENYTRAYIKGKLKFSENSTISFSEFEKGLNNLNASDNFSSILYSFDKDNNLIFNLKENKINSYLKFGLHYDALYKTAFLVNITQKKLLSKNDFVSFDLILGDNFRYNLDYYIDNGYYWSVGVNSRYNSFNKNIKTDFNDGTVLSDIDLNSINIDFSDLSNQFYLQTIFSKKFLIGSGVELKHLKIESPTVQNIQPIFDNSDYLSIFGYLKIDTYDNKYFPKKGWNLNGEIKTFLYSSDYNNNFQKFSVIKGEIGKVYTILPKTTLKVQSEMGTFVGKQSTNYLNFVLGGYGFYKINNFQPFLGYDFLSISGNSYIKGLVSIRQEIFKKNYIDFTANYANIGTRIFENDQWISKPQFSGYSFGYSYESFIGPIEIKHSWSPETSIHYTWFSIGYWF